MSGIPSVSKSIEGTALKRPNVSLTAARKNLPHGLFILKLDFVFVGCILTSISEGSTSEINEIRGTCSPTGIRLSYALDTAYENKDGAYNDHSQRKLACPFLRADSGRPIYPCIFTHGGINVQQQPWF